MEHLLATFVALLMLSSCPLQICASSYTHYRLPVSIQPDRYHLRIITHLDNPANLTFHGEVSIRFQALEDTNNITLHALNLTIDESRLQLKSYDDVDFSLCLAGVDVVPEQDYYIMRLCQNLTKGQEYKVTLYFSGILNEELHGYYRSSYVDEATNETRWLSVTHFEPAFARSAFPCLDEPNYKAKFTISLGHHKSLTALSNMPLAQQIPLDGSNELVWSIFEESVVMPTYLVAYTVNDFAYKESKLEGSDVVFRTWSRPDYIDQCDYAAEVGPNLLKYYEKLFGIPFPMKKIDQIAIPHLNAIAMENWGLITYRETALLYASNVSSLSKKFEIATTVAHELAHQWFGNLVTMKWWTDLWLNEGFATYIASLGVHELSPANERYNIESLHNSISIFEFDAALDSHSISQPILNTSEISDRFDSISYKKGSTVLRMTHNIMGQEGFFEGVRYYLTQHVYQNAEQDDLWAAFTEKAHKFNRIESQYDMKTIMDSWTLQTGYPLVNVSRNYATGSIEISQHRFVVNSNIPDKVAVKCWWVPLSYTTASEFDFTTTSRKAWLECDESGKRVPLKLDNVTGANDWIIFNIQLTGLYRVMYDTHNWRLIRDTLHSDQYLDIHVMNRAQIIGDVLSFAWGGYNDFDITFEILEYLTKEREYLPWKSALYGLIDAARFLQSFPKHKAYFNTYMRYLIEPTYYYVGGLNDTATTSTTHSQMLLKALVTVWACNVEVEDCIQTSIDYFQHWKLSKYPDDQNNIPVDLRVLVYCTAIMHGDKDDWTFLWQRYKESSADREKISIVVALGCSRDETVLRDYIDLIFDNEEHVSEELAFYAFDSTAVSEMGAQVARDYLVEHIARLHERFNVVDLLGVLFYRIVSIEDLTILENLINSNKKYFEDSEKIIQSAHESMGSNRQWIDRNLEDMISHIQRRLTRMGLTEDNVVV